ncbi:hypothetical protein [Halogeometricum luteum]|uniref:GATA-type domain-containing protein n=1 Tax=Halogeometricum luteum TaxID=2950537 RepID=A0ABU2FZ60_9EURY|nr:hypothetical protein [Halogeometricum sp. S3BR5-2]MDS0293213.1 hypothetical protein [Halogeometricum sp. S3BR5-2]
MVSPGKLRLVSELAEGSKDSYRPTVDEGRDVTYPAVDETLVSEETRPKDALESLTEREILERTFEGKVYTCPECREGEMTYATACPRCQSLYIVDTELLQCGGCGRAAPPEAFEDDDGEIVCHGCGSTMESMDQLERTSRYRCHDCGEQHVTPAHALRCENETGHRGGGFACDPHDAVEHALFRYRLGESGEPWLETQVRARRTIAEALEDRGYAVEEDATVTTDAGSQHRLHVYATDELLGKGAVVSVHEQPTVGDVDALETTARELSAQALLVPTLGVVDESVVNRADAADVRIVTVTDEGEIEREYEVTENLGDDRSFLGRLTSSLR